MHVPFVNASKRARLLTCAGLLLALTACQPAQPANTNPVGGGQSEPEDVFVILPGGYSQYLGEGLLFESSGESEDLPVYRTAEDARRALRDFEEHAESSRYIWRIFQLEADWNKDVAALGDDHRLTHAAKVSAVLPDDTNR